MEEQVAVLRRMDERQSTGDLWKQPMPEVPATSSSAWTALLRSALTDTIQPKVDRWRSGLDALLVFLGLFSAIVTSFFVQSLTTLQEDQTVRMNELLANLTDIIIVISDSTDVRLNSLWSLSLILSLSIAALAVACRGFLNMVGWSRFTKASEKLIDIRTRWASSERFLGPTIELLPQLLVIPVLLFIAGLLDTLFSSVLQLSPAPMPILFTSGISLLFISGVAVLLCYTLAQQSINPSGSPFRSTLSHLAHRSHCRPIRDEFPDTLSEKAPSIYHEVVQATHDDDTLNQASAALYNIMQSLAAWPRYGGPDPGLLDQERATFLHLLSPEASTRSNRTAVQVISRIQESNRIRYSPTDMSELVPALLQAAMRPPNASGSIVDLWDSPFIRAMAIVANAGAICNHHPPVMSFLSSEYVDNRHLPSDSDPSAEYGVRTKTLSSIVEILFTKLNKSLIDLPKSMSEDELMDSILSRPQQNMSKTAASPATTSVISGVNPGKIIAALIYLPLPQNVPILTLIIRWLVRTTSPLGVIRATQAHVAATTGHDVWPTILFFIASIAGRVCLATEGFHAHAALAELCISALVKIAYFHQFHPQLPALVTTAVDALKRVGMDGIEPTLRHDLFLVRKFIEDDTWRWSSKQRRAVLTELEALEENEKPGGFSKEDPPSSSDDVQRLVSLDVAEVGTVEEIKDSTEGKVTQATQGPKKMFTQLAEEVSESSSLAPSLLPPSSSDDVQYLVPPDAAGAGTVEIAAEVQITQAAQCAEAAAMQGEEFKIIKHPQLLDTGVEP